MQNFDRSSLGSQGVAMTATRTADAAIEAAVRDHLGVRFTDWLSFLHHDGRWAIVNKLYYAHA